MLLLRGATGAAGFVGVGIIKFQYMLLLRGATRKMNVLTMDYSVSIHAPLARSNMFAEQVVYGVKSFNTCSSCEEQRQGTMLPHSLLRFQYMLLLRGATCASAENKERNMFQYMLLLRGATQRRILRRSTLMCFNTCSSCEEQQVFRVLRHAEP